MSCFCFGSRHFPYSDYSCHIPDITVVGSFFWCLYLSHGLRLRFEPNTYSNTSGYATHLATVYSCGDLNGHTDRQKLIIEQLFLRYNDIDYINHESTIQIQSYVINWCFYSVSKVEK